MFFLDLFFHGLIFAQSLEVTDITSLMSIQQISVNGLLLFAVVMLWRKHTALEDKLDVLRKEKDADTDKYIQLNITTNNLIRENTLMLSRLEKILDK